MADDMTQARQQMLMTRPWHAAEYGSIWEVTGVYPGGKGGFTCCLATVVWVEDGEPLFRFIHHLGRDDQWSVAGPDQISSARRLRLVWDDEPGREYDPNEAVGRAFDALPQVLNRQGDGRG